MIAIPLPFVISLLLVVLWVREFTRCAPHRFHSLLFIALCVILTSLVGLRWSFHWPLVTLIQPVVASLLPPLAWACFADITQRRSMSLAPVVIPLIFALLVALTHLGWPAPLDSALSGLYLGYGVAFGRLGLGSSDNLPAVRLSDARLARRTLLLTGVLLCLSGLSDALIAADFTLFSGQHAALLVAICNLLVLPLLVLSAALGQQSVPAPQVEPTDAAPMAEKAVAASDDDRVIVEQIRALIRDKALFLDPDITLDRLSRKALIPTRQISHAVNRVLQCSVSQLLNSYRVEEACRLLRETELTVTSIIFESGFRTKSNFNREFLRQTGMNPGDYRRANALARPEPETQQ
ncbi:helix-turn-helix domain-containing protein [Ewingella allii]|uniref:helix-turn-helix domain-containing protein n=1 Tax=Ewingella allii TaxID=3092550 RepID=UPI0037B53768